MKKSTFTLFLISITCLAIASQKRKVMIIGIDGTRSDALQQANTPTIDSLIANGTYSFNVYHMGITVSGPSWSDVMCGVWEAKHGVTNNDYTNSRYNTYPYFTTRAKSIKPNLYCSQVVEWPPLNDKVYNDSWNKKVLTACDGCQDTRNNTSELVCDELANDNLDCIFMYLDQVDITGHSSGFNPNNPSYITAIEYVDSRIRKAMNCLKARPNYANEDWLILLVPDHGGIGTGHGGCTKEERNIWWIASGSAVPKQQINAPDPGSYNLLCTLLGGVSAADPAKIKVTPVQTDIAVTALHHLLADSIGDSIEPYIRRWGLDGKSWLRTFSTPTAVINKKSDKMDFKLFPNPVSNILTIWHSDDKKRTKYYINDISGKNICTGELEDDYKTNINCSGLPIGNYIISFENSDNDISSYKFVKE